VITDQPRLLRPPGGATLREYQIVGLQWMVSLYNNHLNGILADEMVGTCGVGGGGRAGWLAGSGVSLIPARIRRP
jgi:hypothetical protein